MFGWIFRDKRTEEFERHHPVGFLRVPPQMKDMSVLRFNSARFVAPKEVLLMDYCTRTEDQGATPMCAGYAASLFAENVLWRKNDVPTEISARLLYEHAKSIDGEPDVDGTSLAAVMQSLLDLNIFDKDICKINIIKTIPQIQFAIHKFGCCLLGLNISREWYACNAKKATIYGSGDQTLIGGHAVLCCGYNRDGVMIANSWGEEWAHYGFALLTWECLEKQFIYGAVLTNCLNDFKMN